MQDNEKVLTAVPEKLPALPGMLLRAVPTVRRRRQPKPTDIPAIHGYFQAPPIRSSELQAYRDSFPGLLAGELPLSYLYFLAQRSHLATMLDERFPWPIMGMVHVANDMRWHQQPNVNLNWELEVTIQMPPRAGARKRVRPIYLTRFWQGATLIAECHSTYQVGTGQNTGKARQRKEPIPAVSNWQQSPLWSLGSAAGREYAKLSGDYNPIHLHSWVSRWFGFPRPIIHGMWSASRAQSDLETAVAQPVQRLHIAFRRPLALPAEARFYFHLQESDRSGEFTVLDPTGTRCFLTGQFAYGPIEKNTGEQS